MHNLSSATQTHRQVGLATIPATARLGDGDARKSALSILGSFLLPVSRCRIIQLCRYCVDISHYIIQLNPLSHGEQDRSVSELRAREFIAACVLDYIIWRHFYMTQCRAGAGYLMGTCGKELPL